MNINDLGSFPNVSFKNITLKSHDQAKGISIHFLISAPERQEGSLEV